MKKSITLLFLTLSFFGCAGSPAVSETTSGGETYAGAITSTDIAMGEQIYAQNCNGCHPGGQAGYGPIVRSIGWTTEHTRKQIREGEGRMPGFGAEDIDATELEALLAYLQSIGAVNQ